MINGTYHVGIHNTLAPDLSQEYETKYIDVLTYYLNRFQGYNRAFSRKIRYCIVSTDCLFISIAGMLELEEGKCLRQRSLDPSWLILELHQIC